MTPGSIFAEYLRLLEDCSAKSDAARMKRPDSKAAVEAKAAESKFDEFRNGLANDVFVMLIAARNNGQRGAGIDEFTDEVARRLSDRLDFDAVSSEVHFANRKVAEVRREAEQLRREVDELRRMVETMQFEKPPLKVVG